MRHRLILCLLAIVASAASPASAFAATSANRPTVKRITPSGQVPICYQAVGTVTHVVAGETVVTFRSATDYCTGLKGHIFPRSIGNVFRRAHRATGWKPMRGTLRWVAAKIKWQPPNTTPKKVWSTWKVREFSGPNNAKWAATVGLVLLGGTKVVYFHSQ
jgi:hypothetical protein